VRHGPPAGAFEVAAVTHRVPRGSRDQNTRQAKLLIVDDEELNGLIVKKHLQVAGYEQCVVLEDSVTALAVIRDEKPDLVILDVMMPQVSGLDILQVMSLDTELQSIPVVIMTASTETVTKYAALELGAADFLAKPIDPNELIVRVRNTLASKLYQDRLKDSAAELERQVRERTAELVTSRAEVVHCLARACEYRDNETGHHIIRVGRYVGLIARKLGCSEQQVEILDLAARLHDIGKIAMPDDILRKPGKLDPEQHDLMKTHCFVGTRIIEPIREDDCTNLRTDARLAAGALQRTRRSPLLILAAKIAQSHHEWWNGTGYPLGLAGEEIPIEGRIAAIADVFDALTSVRPYKPAYRRERSFEMMAELRGTQFDPRLLDLFLQSDAEITRIQMEYMDRN